MILARVRFGSVKNADKENLVDEVTWYLTLMLRNGQILDDFLYAWQDGVLNAFANLVAPDALRPQSFSSFGKGQLEKVREAFGRDPEWTILDDEVPRGTPRWQTAPFLVLYADALRSGPPVRRGGDGKQIPTYRLPPLQHSEHEALYHWQHDYQTHDHIWFHSGTLETPAYRELADPNSLLSGKGRRLCEEIEDATGKPTFYYLMRHYGRRKGEGKRKCPGCGRRWRTDLSESVPFDLGRFHFQCEKCRLVSHLANTDDDERHARIGEYGARKRGRRKAAT